MIGGPTPEGVREMQKELLLCAPLPFPHSPTPVLPEPQLNARQPLAPTGPTSALDL